MSFIHPTANIEAQSTGVVSSAGGPTAIVVDDSATMRAAVKQALRKAGVQVVGESATGANVVELYQKHKPTLVMLDIVLPQCDGVTIAKNILTLDPDAKVVMCSSLTDRARIMACREAGAKHFILKPFNAEKVIELVRTLCAVNSVSNNSPAAA